MATKYKRVHQKKWPGVYYYEGANKHLGRSDVCYHICFKIDGKLKWEKVGWKSEGYTPQVAAELRSERVRKARHGQDVQTHKEIREEKAKKSKTLDEVSKEYFKHRGGDKRSGHFDQLRYDKHVKPILGDRPVKDIAPLDMERIKKNMSELAPATVWGALELVRRISNFGARTGMCDPLKFKVQLPKLDNQKVEYLEPEQLQRLLEVLEVWPFREPARMIKLALFTGMRRGEIFRLQDRDLDFRQGLITLRSPKGGKTVSIPLNPVADEILQEQVAQRDHRRPRCEYVFPGKKGQQRTECKSAYRIRDKAGLEDFRIFHGLRHHFAVTLANSGEFGLDMIGELLTHKSPQMTKRYAQYLPDTMKKASARASELLQVKGQEEEEPDKVVNIDQAKREG